ncbi:ABC transporter permease [Candidatus Desantisbacteria bacterium]|nr:ABC transporter permease [Candidatus Desantisbacteria bacterium]
MSILNFFRYISLRHIRFQKTQSIVVLLSICLGIATIVSITIVNRSVLYSYEDTFNKMLGRSSLQISGPETGFPENLVDKVLKVPGVEYAAPVIETQGILIGAKEHSIMILGVDVLQDNQIRDYSISGESADIPDPLLFLAKPGSILIPRSLAESEKIEIDQDVQIQTVYGIQKFRVRGLLNPEGPAKAVGGNIAVMDIFAAQMAFGKEARIDRIDIGLYRGTDIEEVQHHLEKTIPQGYKITTPAGRTKQVQKILSSMQSNIDLIGYISIIVGMYLIYNAVSITVVRRKKEIGILRALGATRSQIIKTFLGEHIIIATVASALGVALGILFAKAAVGAVGEIISSMYMRTSVSEIKIYWADIFSGFAAGILATLIASLIPAFSTANITPILAIRSVPYSEEKMLTARTVRMVSILLVFLSIVLLIFYKATKFFPVFHNKSIIFLSVTAILVGISLSTTDFLRWVLTFFQRFILPLFSGSPRLAGLNLQKNISRNAVAVAAVFYSIAIFVSSAGFMYSIKESILSYTDSVVRGDILVTSGHPLSVGSQNIPMPVELGKEIEKIPGVLSADPFRKTYIDYSGKRVVLLTVDVARRLEYSPFMFAQGTHDEMVKLLPHNDAAVVSEGFASHFNVVPGDTITLSTPQGPVPFHVVAIIVDYMSDVGSVLVDIDTYQRHWGDMLAETFSVRVKPGESINTVQEAIMKKFGANRKLFVLSGREFKEESRKLIDQTFIMHYAVNIISMIIACFGIIVALLASVLERTREIGILRSIGMLRSQVSRVVMLESVILGISGGVLGSLTGVLLGWISLDGFYRVDYGASIAYYIPYMYVIWAIIISAGLATLAGLYPAHRAAKTNIVEALNYE